MAAAVAYRSGLFNMQDTLNRLDAEGFDLFDVHKLNKQGTDFLVIGVPRPVELTALLEQDVAYERDAARGDGRGGGP